MGGGTRLSEICTRITDGTHYSPKDEGEGRAFISVKDMKDAGIDFEGCFHIGEAAFAQVKASGSVPVAGDILFSKDGTVGKVAVVPEGAEFGVLSSIAILQPDHEVVDSRYLAQVLKSPDTLADALGRKTGSALRRLILKDLKGIRVPLPPLEEQRRIAHLLDEADRLQRLRKEANDKAQRILPALFVEMFGDPETNPMGWERKSLDDLCDVSGGATPSTKEAAFWNGDIAWATPKDLSGNWDFVLEDTERHITKAGMASCATRLAPAETVLLSCRAPIGLSAISGRSMCANQGFKTLACGAEVNAWYLLAWLRLSKDYLQSLGRGATFKEVSTKIVREIEIPVPPRTQQDAFAARMKALREILLAEDDASASLVGAGATLRSRLFAEAE